MFSYIIWTATPEIIPGTTFPVWYGPLFASGFVVGYMIIARIFKLEGKSEKDLDTLLMYMVGATVLGARLGHCFFYEPAEYLANPIKILYVWEGGLASHGATIGILLGLYLYSRKRAGQNFLWVTDRIVIVVAFGGAMIRMGNLMNHEIIGKPADEIQSFIFTNSLRSTLQHIDSKQNSFSHFSLEADKTKKDTIVKKIIHKPMVLKVYYKGTPDAERSSLLGGELYHYINNSAELPKHFRQFRAEMPKSSQAGIYQVLETKIYGIPRHPAQLYEAISTFMLFLFLYFLYHLQKEKTPNGQLLGLFLIILFILRFLYEFLKENQVAFENELSYNMGQILSIPGIIFGILVLGYSFISKKAK
ncbi:MAG: prolipoprotein diacylglyceryl transferase [Bacteroidetes bacterium]|nr:MAG: prolipoprotein diacylglyceryl transferase [Bacteroidota bacterium]TAG89278.1 MAG: prolipoprotein diacylglyceryl transferase [Bacteroidota bacterium]